MRGREGQVARTYQVVGSFKQTSSPGLTRSVSSDVIDRGLCDSRVTAQGVLASVGSTRSIGQLADQCFTLLKPRCITEVDTLLIQATSESMNVDEMGFNDPS